MRKPPQPPGYRRPGYEEDFDFTTVFCDAFWSADGASIVTHGRYVTFQMAEVAVPRGLFQEILRLIAQLRPPPAPA